MRATFLSLLLLCASACLSPLPEGAANPPARCNTTLDPTQSHPELLLLSNGEGAFAPEGVFQAAAYTNQGYRDGAVYFEAILLQAGAPDTRVGVGERPEAPGSIAPGDARGAALLTQGSVIASGRAEAARAPLRAGDIIGVAAYLEAGFAYFHINGEWIAEGGEVRGFPLGGAPGEGELFAAVSVSDGGAFLLNLAGPFAFSLPGGFHPYSTGPCLCEVRLDPDASHPSITLSADGTEARTPRHTSNNVAWTTHGRSTGRFYFEAVAEAGLGADTGLGVSNEFASNERLPGANGDGASLLVDGQILFAGGATAAGPQYRRGEIVGVQLDLDARTIQFQSARGRSEAVPLGAGEVFFPALTLSQRGRSSLNVAGPFWYGLPEGFAPFEDRCAR